MNKIKWISNIQTNNWVIRQSSKSRPHGQFFCSSILEKNSSTRRFTDILFKVFLTLQQIGKTLITAIKLVLNSVSWANTTKRFCIINIKTKQICSRYVKRNHLFFPTNATLVWLENTLFSWHFKRKPLFLETNTFFIAIYIWNIKMFHDTTPHWLVQ